MTGWKGLLAPYAGKEKGRGGGPASSGRDVSNPRPPHRHPLPSGVGSTPDTGTHRHYSYYEQKGLGTTTSGNSGRNKDHTYIQRGHYVYMCP